MGTSTLIYDAVCPIDTWLAGYQEWLAGGFAACSVTIGGQTPAQDALTNIGRVHRTVREDPRLVLAVTADDVRRAHDEGTMAVLFNLQGMRPLEYDVDLVDVFWHLGVRVMQLAYNQRGLVCDGCLETADAGVSDLGKRMIAAMNRRGVIIDVSHTGWRSSREAIDASTGPVIASHSNAHAVHQHRRNIPDDIIKAIAETGGVIGMNGFPAFISSDSAPTLDHLIDHMVYVDSLVGSGHVGLGLDYTVVTEAEYQDAVAQGMWTVEDYPPLPWTYPRGIETARTVRALEERMAERGYQESERQGILGENWLRLYDAAWG